MTDTVVWVLLGLGLTGIVSLVVWLGFLTQNKDNASEIRKNLGIVGGITAVLVGIFAVVSYIYFTVNPGYIPMFALILTFINLFLSTFAVASSSLSVINS
jgi:hypothetical protein